MVDQYSAEDLQNAGRLKQIRMVAKLVNEQNKRALPITFGAAAGVIVVFVLIGLFVGPLALFLPIGILLGLRTAMMPTAEPKTIGSARLFCWLTSFATIRICLNRPAFSRSSALYWSTTAQPFLLTRSASLHQ